MLDDAAHALKQLVSTERFIGHAQQFKNGLALIGQPHAAFVAKRLGSLQYTCEVHPFDNYPAVCIACLKGFLEL